MKRVTLLDFGAGDEGHRGPYVVVLSKFFQLDRRPLSWAAIRSRDPVLVPLIEDSLLGYTAVALLRSVMGRRTAGLLFRPRPALEGQTLRLRLKRYVLGFLRRLPRVQTITILPFSVEPTFSKVATSWIYDPQLWDLDFARPSSISQNLVTQLKNVSAGRPICVSLGRQDRSKGFDRFTSTFLKSADLRESVLFAFGGKVDKELRPNLDAFCAAGGFACDRFISDEELLALYSCATTVWCVYAPDYDQASGILGRAAQLGIPVIVRRDSLIHRLCEVEGFAHLAIDECQQWHSLLAMPPRESIEVLRARTFRLREESLRRLDLALGFSL